MKDLQRITYVEDEPHIREIVQLALEELGGYTLQVCESGAEALDNAPIFHPDLVMLDVMMPGMNGIQTFRSLKQLPHLADTPIVFVTAKAQKHEIQQYLSLGAIDVIPKPFDPVTLPADIMTIWRRTQDKPSN
ncbi:MAG: response regulator [Rhodomicrobium sp.]|nr:response regulator [Rhodomicrobium sp.]